MSEFEARKRIALQLLFDLAAELRFVPVGEKTRSLHLRALELKRDVRTWDAAPPPPRTIDEVTAELRDLLAVARGARSLTWRRELSRASA